MINLEKHATTIQNQLAKTPLVNIYLPPFAWALIIFLLSSQTTLPSFAFSLPDFLLKKTAHIVVYAILFSLVLRSLTLSKVKAGKAWRLAFFITFLYALSDELHQSTVPGRFGSMRDIGFDMLGATLAFSWKYQYI